MSANSFEKSKEKTQKKPLTESLLLGLAGSRSFDRGKAYFEDGRVADLLIREGAATATVAGSRRYKVRLELGGGGIEAYDCSCPVGEDGDFCKHCVTVGLALLEQGVEAPPGKGKTKAKPVKERPPTWDEVAEHIWGMEQKDLVALVLESAKKEDGLYRKLAMAAARARGKTSAASLCRAELADAFHVDGYVDYHEAWGFTRRIGEAIDSLEDLLQSGAASECVNLAEFAFGRLDRTVERMDDSDGGCSILAERLSAIHFAACKAAKPDQGALAQRLFALELSDEWGWWSHAVRTYAQVLGKKGIEAFRRLAEKEWESLPPLKPGAGRHVFGGSRRTIQSIMEDLAELDGDTDALIAIISRDISHSWDFLRIVTVCEKAGRHEEAVEWAERGISAFPDVRDSELSDFLAADYIKKGRASDAMGFIWRQFEGNPWLHQYQKLKTFAVKVKAWPEWREKALAFLRADLERRKGARQNPWSHKSDASVLVEIFLWEKDLESAWVEAQAGGCRDELWLKLANLRDKDHPQDAIEVYQRLVEVYAGRKTKRDYEDAAALVKQIRHLLNTMDRTDDFASYLAQLRLRHKPKRNFMRELSRV